MSTIDNEKLNYISILQSLKNTNYNWFKGYQRQPNRTAFQRFKFRIVARACARPRLYIIIIIHARDTYGFLWINEFTIAICKLANIDVIQIMNFRIEFIWAISGVGVLIGSICWWGQRFQRIYRYAKHHWKSIVWNVC